MTAETGAMRQPNEGSPHGAAGPSSRGGRSWFGATRDYARMVRFSHSIFALPFALASALFASSTTPLTAWSIVWIVVAMIAARNAAMGFNRFADANIDAKNPRTRMREIPRGALGRVEVAVFVAVLSGLFILASAMLNRTCLFLSPVALGLVFVYSYTKRFTWASQLALGLCLAIAPVGAWIAVTGGLGWPAVLLGIAVLLWVAGFDIIYSLQDVDFDRREGLHSIPARFGASTGLAIARVFHAGAVAALISIYPLQPLHPVYFLGIVAVAGLLIYEHSLVKPDDLSRVNIAFFTANGLVSIVYFLAAAAAVALRP